MRAMRWILAGICLVGLSGPATAGLLDDIFQAVPALKGGASSRMPDEATTIRGLKEALSVGAGNAVRALAKKNGYFGNDLVKILLPDTVQKVADVASKVGFQREVDEFVLSMNRAAEAAAPKAADLFADSIRAMTFEDARQILQGGDTAATDYFRRTTSERLYGEFKPIVATSMSRVGVTKAYKAMMEPYTALPFASKESVDLDHYVTDKALDGLFRMIGEEEKKIRTDPAARVTDILKTVFGSGR